MAEDRPDVVVYDLARPYDRNWDLLRIIGTTAVAKESSFILTTADKTGFEQEVGPTEALALSGWRDELAEVVKAVRRALEARAQGTAPQ